METSSLQWDEMMKSSPNIYIELFNLSAAAFLKYKRVVARTLISFFLTWRLFPVP